MPKEIQTTTLPDALTAALGLRGRLPLSIDEMVALVLRGPDLEHARFSFPQRKRLCEGGTTLAATPANFGHVGLFNPAGSGSLVVTDVYRLLSGSQLVEVRRIDVPVGFPAGFNPTVFRGARDFRWTGAFGVAGPLAAQVGSILNAVQQGNRISQAFTGTTGGGSIYEEPWVLPPGTGVFWVESVFNSAIDLNISWTEFLPTSV